MPTLFGNEISSPSNKTRFVLNALGIPYEYRNVDLMTGENKTEAYLKMHPAGKVPVLKDGDFVLFESNAIIKYLATKENSNLYPGELRRRAKIDQWLDFVSIHIGVAMSKVFINRVAYGVLGMEKDERSLQEGQKFLDRFLPVLEAQLQKSAYLAEPEMTLADFGLLAHLDQAEVSQVDLSVYPRLKEWQAELMGKEFYQKCFPSYAKMLLGIASKMKG